MMKIDQQLKRVSSSIYGKKHFVCTIPNFFSLTQNLCPHRDFCLIGGYFLTVLNKTNQKTNFVKITQIINQLIVMNPFKEG